MSDPLVMLRPGRASKGSDPKGTCRLMVICLWSSLRTGPHERGSESAEHLLAHSQRKMP